LDALCDLTITVVWGQSSSRNGQVFNLKSIAKSALRTFILQYPWTLQIRFDIYPISPYHPLNESASA